LRVRVRPRAGRAGVAGEREGALVVRVAAAPVEGAANEALRQLLGRALGLAATRIEVVRGARGRDKLVRVAGLDAAALRARLAGTAGGADGA